MAGQGYQILEDYRTDIVMKYYFKLREIQI